MMIHFLYILHSPSKDAFYTGESHDVEARLIKHNAHAYSPKSFTKSASDWEVALKYPCSSREEALYLERFIKRMKSKVFIRKIIEDPNILQDVLKKR